MAYLWGKTPDASLANVGIQTVCVWRGAECIVSLAGRITIDSSPELRLFLMKKLESPACRILTVDFGAVPYIDTSGLAILVELLKLARIQGKTLGLKNLREGPRYLLEATHLVHLFGEMDAEYADGSAPSPGRP